MGGERQRVPVTFFDRWRHAREGGALVLPSVQPQVLIRVGVAKRVSKCHVCFSPILVGDERIEFFIRFGMFRKYTNGGGSSGSISYVHSGCMMRYLNGSLKVVREGGPDQCISCRTTIKRGSNGMFAGYPFVVSASLMTYVCIDCAGLPAFQRCDYCGLWSYVHRMTPLMNHSGYVCHHCDDEFEVLGRPGEYETVRSVKRDKLLFRKAKRGYEQAEAWVNQFRAVR